MLGKPDEDLGTLVANLIACDQARFIADRLETDINADRFDTLERRARARLVEVG